MIDSYSSRPAVARSVIDTDRAPDSFVTAAATAGSYGLILLVMFVLLFVVPFLVFRFL